MTKKADRKTSRVEGIINDIVGKSPHSKEIITAFKPLFLVRERLLTIFDIDRTVFHSSRHLRDYFSNSLWHSPEVELS